MVVSIITVVYNNVEHIRNSIESVVSQNYPYIEYIVVDGGSADGTIDIIKEYKDNISVFISEEDNGIYDALNKGIFHASGDVISILHSDDIFCDAYVVSDTIKKMDKQKAEFCFSDMVIVDNSSGEVLRYYMANYFKRWMFRIGWMPPHPTCFINKSLFDEFGMYSTEYKIAGDFDFFVRIFYGKSIRWAYLNRITVRMSHGGISNSGWQSKMLIFNEISRSLKTNNVWSLPIFYLARYAMRLMEIIVKPKNGGCD
ncbi:glycosyltransferase [Candidatus Pseudothioglobus singularis]|nr:glycosyltransferase [Candidatus Pseudothioglobus singularis]